MIKRLICRLWGCSPVRSFHYNRWVTANHFECGTKYEHLGFCKRCGKDMKNEA